MTTHRKVHTRYAIAKLLAFCMLTSFVGAGGILTGNLSPPMSLGGQRAEVLDNETLPAGSPNYYGSLSLPPGATALFVVVATNITSVLGQLRILGRRASRLLNAAKIGSQSLFGHLLAINDAHCRLSLWPTSTYRTKLPPNHVAGASASAKANWQTGALKSYSRPPYYAMDQPKRFGRHCNIAQYKTQAGIITA